MPSWEDFGYHPTYPYTTQEEPKQEEAKPKSGPIVEMYKDIWERLQEIKKSEGPP